MTKNEETINIPIVNPESILEGFILKKNGDKYMLGTKFKGDFDYSFKDCTKNVYEKMKKLYLGE
ncbi:MAG: hypothetical protein GY853_16510 [PVC group bacterium]|nr:hypothetical protein [PVC group bacterium]